MIIGFSGFVKVGKSTASEILVDINPSFKIKSFAGPLKEAYAKHAQIPLEYLYDNDEKEVHRKELIDFANQMRKKDPYIFANKLMKNIKKGDNIVIDDLRLLPELEVLVKAGAKIYRVNAPHHIRKARGWIPNPIIDQDITETDLNLSAETYSVLGGGSIYNNTNVLEDLQRQIFNLLLKIN